MINRLKNIQSNDLDIWIVENPRLPENLTFVNNDQFKGQRDIDLLHEAGLPLVDNVIIYQQPCGNSVYFNGNGLRARIWYRDGDTSLDDFILFYNRHCRLYISETEREMLKRQFNEMKNRNNYE